MTKLLLILSLLIPLTAISSPLKRLDGSFKYDGLILLQSRDVEVVDYRNPERVKELMNDGFTCQRVVTSYKCIKFLKLTRVPSGIQENILKDWKNTVFEFTPSSTDPLLVNDAEMIKEYQVDDSVSMNSLMTDQYRYNIIHNDLHKIKVEFDQQTVWMVVASERKLRMPLEMRMKMSNTRTRFHLIDVTFKR